jgi:hypothetical protein
VVLQTLRNGCSVDLPDNVHINLDLLRRLTGRPPARLKRILGGLQSLGFTCRVRQETETDHHRAAPLGHSEMLELEWIDLSEDADDYPELIVATEMVLGATDRYCDEHGWPFLQRLDFSQLSKATTTAEPAHPQASATATGSENASRS